MNNAIIAGSGVLSGGSYGQIRIMGSAKASGKIKAEDISVSGAAKFENDIEASYVRISGSFKCNSSVYCKTFKCSGAASVEGNLEADKISISGNIKINGDINTDVLIADTSSSAFCNIYGDNITITSKKIFTEVNEIEATSIHLKNVKANKVSGDKVEIYGDSIINLVEFGESLSISKNCKIKQIVKM